MYSDDVRGFTKLNAVSVFNAFMPKYINVMCDSWWFGHICWSSDMRHTREFV